MPPFPTIARPRPARRSMRGVLGFWLLLALSPYGFSDEEGPLPSEVVDDPPVSAPEETKTLLPPTAPPHRYSLLKEPLVFKPLRDFGTKISVTMPSVNNEKILQLQYDLRRGDRVACFAGMRVNLARCERVRLILQGEGPANTLQIQLTDADGSMVGYSWPDGTDSPQWTATEVPLNEMRHFPGGDGFMDWTRVTTVQFNVTKANGGQGGRGTVTLKEIKFY
jgi:hypothetical protein